MIEQCVSKQLHNHFKCRPLPTSQSGYRPFHSTETALVGFINDIRHSLSNDFATASVSLDLSAAFDTVDHQILLNRMSTDYGVGGTCQSWFASYLHHRQQSVVVGENTSDPAVCRFGVPQGSVLGPTLFSMYTSPINELVERHG